MALIDGAVTMLRFVLTSIPSLAIIIMLNEGIKQYRPDIVDQDNRAHSISLNELRDEYDFIIVGGGSAGCALAARLSEVPHWNILLIEAGGDEPLLIDVPQLYPAFQRSPWDWLYRTEPSDRYCLAMQYQQCNWPRGRVLGGCSSINAMMYIRGNRKDYDHWAQLGNEGWNYDSVLPYFKKMEDIRVPGFERNFYHGHGGPITVERYRFPSPLIDVFMEAASELGVVSNLSIPYVEK